MIDHRSPKDWKDLQNKVAEIFIDVGYKTATNQKIETVRGSVNVDVISIDESQSPQIIYICECKHWETLVPKTIVHAFRTVVQDYGANFGIIITRKGFQKGAYAAARNTNIRLVDWPGFQDMFEEKWFPAVCDKLYDKYEALIDYTEPLIGSSLGKKLDQLNKDEIERFLGLRKKYMSIGMLILHLKYGRSYQDVRQGLKFPLNLQISTEEQDVLKTEKIRSQRELIDRLDFWGKKALKEIDEVFK